MKKLKSFILSVEFTNSSCGDSFKEVLEINRSKSILSLCFENNSVNFSIKDKETVDELLTVINGFCEPPVCIFRGNADILFNLECVYSNGETKSYVGDYTRLFMLDGWDRILEILRPMFYYGGFKMDKSLILSKYRYDLLNTEVLYLTVHLPYCLDDRYYQAKDPYFCIGDLVYIPLGDDGSDVLCRIKKVEIFDINEVPKPLNDTKFILYKYKSDLFDF